MNLDSMQEVATVSHLSASEIIAASIVGTSESKVVFGRDDGTVAIWDFIAGSAEPSSVTALRDGGHRESVIDAKTSEDGKTALTCSDDCELKLWDLRSHRCVRTLSGHGASIGACDMDAAARVVVSGDGNGDLRTWDLGSGRYIAKWKENGCAVASICMHSSGRLFITADFTGRVCTWLDVDRSRPLPPELQPEGGPSGLIALWQPQRLSAEDMSPNVMPDLDEFDLYCTGDLSLVMMSQSDWGASNLVRMWQAK